MKYARRSVSDQDIRRYEMFAQVIDLSHGSYVISERVLIHVIFPSIFRICNSLARLDRHSSSLRVHPRRRVVRRLQVEMRRSETMRKTTTCMRDLHCVVNGRRM